jgi:HEAT repeat protein
MKSRLEISLLIFLVSGLILPSLGAADKGGALAARVSAVVARFPGQNTAENDALAAELMSFGQEGILSLCRMLASPGGEDDTKVRFAVNGLATYASSARLEGQRKMLANALVKALDRGKSKDVQAFLISQLQLAGRAESIKPLAKYLGDQKLCEPAAQALLSIGTPDVEAALLKALDGSSGPNSGTIIKSLGDLQSRKATNRLLVYASSPDPGIRQAALYALARGGDPRAENALNRLMLEAGLYERTIATSLYLLYARRLAESGNRMQAIRICRSLIKNYSAPEESRIACAALHLLADVLGDGAMDDVLAALSSGSKDVRWTALNLANRLEGGEVTARLLNRMAGAPMETQAEIITALGLRDDKTALPAVMDRLDSGERVVRLAAIPAAARLGGSRIIPELFARMNSEDEEEIKAAGLALLGFSREQVIPQAANLISQMPLPAQAVLIKILAERGASEHIDLIFAKTKIEDENVRLAALAALEPLAAEKDLPRLIALLRDTDASREKTLIQNAIAASSNQIAEPEERADLLLEAIEKAQGKKRADLIVPLPKIGGRKALGVLETLAKSEDPEVQTAAVYALSHWPDFLASGPLLDIGRTTASRKLRYLSFQGFVRLVNNEDLNPQEKFKMLSEALAIPAEPAEKKLVLDGLSRIKTKDSLMLVADYLGDQNLKKESAIAASRIALPERSKDDGLDGLEVIRLLRRAEGAIDDEDRRKEIEDYLKMLLVKEGFRPLFNGQDLTGWKGLVGDPPSRGRMSPQELEKAQAEADSDMRAHWKVIDGILLFDGAGHSLCTAKDYGDFELFIDWKIETKGDSGVYLRGSPQVQIWDPEQWPEGSGGLYNNEKGPNKPLKRADNPVGEWNTFYIRMAGERLTVYLNSMLVVDDVVMENYWERDKPIYPLGQIELQAHSTPLFFRNIYIRDISPIANSAKFR